MNMKEAWNTAKHGEAIVNTSSQTRFEKWISDKPGLAPCFDRFLLENVANLDSSDLVSSDWMVDV